MLRILTPVLCLAVGCGHGNVTLELKNVPDGSTRSARSAVRVAPVDQTSAMTIDSLRVPIVDVGFSYADELFGSMNSAYLYGCGGSSQDCEVELVGPALQNLLGGNHTGDLEVGKMYSSVMIGTCGQGETGYTAKLKATATIDGTVYYTKTGASYLTTAAADYGPVEIAFQGCRNYTVLSRPITYDGAPVTVSLYIDLRDLVHVFGPGSSLYPAAARSRNCSVGAATPAGAPYICLESPNVGGTIATGAPTVERYRVSDATMTAGAPEVIGFVFDADGQPIGGYNRSYLEDVTNETFLLSQPSGFKKSHLETDGRLYFTDYSGDQAGSVADHVASQGNFTVAAFPRPSGAQSATITTIQTSAGQPATVNYAVTRLAN
jgi:hypothetical protein